MSSETPCLHLAIKRLEINHLSTNQMRHYAVWVIESPYPAGYEHHDRPWTATLTQAWNAWQEMFSSRGLPNVPYVSEAAPVPKTGQPAELVQAGEGAPLPLGIGRMQGLGITLWQWLFNGAIQDSFNRSQGFANAKSQPLRLRLEIRDADLIQLPWEIMQEQAAKQAISLSQQVLFSRTTYDVDPLPVLRNDQSLRILLVLGQDSTTAASSRDFLFKEKGSPQDIPQHLKLEQEAIALSQLLETSSKVSFVEQEDLALCQVDTLIQPTPAQLIQQLEGENYNVFFYAGHGVSAPDGGLLLLRADTTLNGTELAQVLTRCQVKLAVFNACWGAQPEEHNHQPIPRSSLAEVLIHHGVPAVLAMRDSITDQEARSFIQSFTRELVGHKPIDQAMAIARQDLLTLYKFNQPAWTLPVLYMHPDFNGELIHPQKKEDKTVMPPVPSIIHKHHRATLRLVGNTSKSWKVRAGMLRIGRSDSNDVVITHLQTSRRQAEIFCADMTDSGESVPQYFLKDISSYGTLVLDSSQQSWKRVNNDTVPLESGSQLKFSGMQGDTYEFVLEQFDPSKSPEG
jgi:hypothetical protein